LMSMTVPPFEFVVVIALDMEKACEPKILTSAQQIKITILRMITSRTFFFLYDLLRKLL